MALNTNAVSGEHPLAGIQTPPSVIIESPVSITTSDTDQTSSIARNVGTVSTESAPLSLNTPTTPIPSADSNTISMPTKTVPAILSSLAMTSAARSHSQGQDSPVMNETLSVIDEHITDMNAPHHGGLVDRRGTNDSGSEYSSSQLGPRLSYINGNETDEEEGDIHTRGEVLSWNADQVATFLAEVGVEAKHCEVFREQEITGDVLLGMDQTSVFLKEFDLGSVGRRLKTWQKIKALQDEVNGESSTRRNTATYGSDISSDDAGRNRSRSEASTMAPATILPRMPTLTDRPTSRQNTRLSQQQLSRSDTVRQSPGLSSSNQDSPRPTPEKRPSAASVRDLHHSRQNSGTDIGTLTPRTTLTADGSTSSQQEGHRKQPSFDRNWTMGDALSPPLSTPLPARPLSSSGMGGFTLTVADHDNQSILDRGYLSGGEIEGRQRNVLRKRAGSAATHHSRNSSYTDEQRIRSATTNSRHSRFGSFDSVRDSTPPSAAQKYYGLTVNNRSTRRTPSESSINAPPRPPPPPKDFPSPTMNKLQGTPYEQATTPPPASRQGGTTELQAPSKAPSASRHFGLRAISDAVTGHERSKVTSPTESHPNSAKEPLESPSTRTGSSTPSGGQSFDLDSPDGKGTSGMVLPGTSRASAKKKSKKETSAYTRGLEKKTPQEQMVGADYSGWMKKKSSNLMATWKPRLFILKGRRLSYYYSENDTEERGLIDISFHKVLPADNERLTGLHATLTGATNSPTSPLGAQETAAEKDAAQADSRGLSDSMFIFKLQPPKAGLARAVNFTKPTVHYFAVPNITIGRLWMAALVKATIDRDDTKAVVTTYQQKTISLEKARKMRHRPPALMNLDEHVDEEVLATPASDKHGLNIQGIIFDQEPQEGDSGVSGVSRPEPAKPESAGMSNGNSSENQTEDRENEPKTA